jgi:hypothetical protein
MNNTYKVIRYKGTHGVEKCEVCQGKVDGIKIYFVYNDYFSIKGTMAYVCSEPCVNMWILQHI